MSKNGDSDKDFLGNKFEDITSKYNMLLYSMSGGVVIMTQRPGEKLIPNFVSESFCNMLGFTYDEMMEIYRDDAFAGLHPDDFDRVYKGFYQCMEKGGPFRDTYRLKGKNGDYFWVKATINIEISRDGTMSTYAVYTDVDELKRSEQALRTEKYKTDIALESTDISIWEYDIVNKRYIYVKKKADAVPEEHIIENVPESVLEMNIIAKESVKDFVDMHKAIEEGAPSCSADIHFTEPEYNGWRHCTYTTIFNEDKRPVSAVGSVSDYSTVRQLAERYRRMLNIRESIDKDSIGSFRLNLTKNWCSEGTAVDDRLLRLQGDNTADGFLENSAKQLPDKGQRETYKSIFNRGNLLNRFFKGNYSLSYEHRYMIGFERVEWVVTTALMMENPETHDIECFIYSRSIDRQKITKAIVDHLIGIEYEFIAIIRPDTGTISFERIGHLNEGYMDEGNYQQLLNKFLSKTVEKSELKHIYNAMSLETVKHELENSPIYTCSSFLEKEDGTQKRKKWKFTYLDEGKTAIALTRSDITKEYQQEYDLLTGLYNRGKFYEAARALIVENPKMKFVILRFDIDRFKVYNDIYGVKSGDRLLEDIGKYYRTFSKDMYVRGHLEADHFISCMPKNIDTIYKNIEHMTNWLKAYRPDFEFIPRFGIYEIIDTSVDISLMSDRALLALRSIKGSYTEHVAWYDESMRQSILEEQELVRDMEYGLENGQFIIHVQPQYNQVKSELIGAETLVRWQHPKKGMIPPDKFISLFERNGFITRLDEYVWEQACMLLQKWKTQFKNVPPLSVNISRIDIYNPRLCDILTSLIKKYDLKPSKLHLEITETAYMDNPNQLMEVVKRLKSLGFIIEMDDFGSGYSSLNTLKNVPVDMLKLDLKFLKSDDSEKGKSGIILNSIVRMAHWLGLPVIAEGVETKREADYLKTIGCELVQGYLYGKPMPVGEYEKLILNSNIGELTASFWNADFFDSSEFWAPDSQATVIFNSFVGAVGIFEYGDGEAETLRVNDKCYEELGISRESKGLANLNIRESILPEDTKTLFSMIDDAINTDGEASSETRWTIKSGSQEKIIWLKIRVRVIARNLGRYIFYATIENITKRKKLENENVGLANRLSALFASVPCGIIQFSFKESKLDTMSINETAWRAFGYESKKDCLDTMDETFFSKSVYYEDQDSFMTNIYKVIETGRPYDFESRIVRRSGDLRWVHTFLQVVPSNLGDSFIQVVFVDITERKENDLNKYMKALYGAYDDVFEVEAKSLRMKLLFTKSELYEIGKENEITFERWLSYIYPDDRRKVLDFFKYGGSTLEANVSIEYRIERCDGEIRWIEASILQVEKSTYFMCVRDVTLKKDMALNAQANAALKAAALEKHANDERNRIFVADSKTIIFDYDPNTDIMSCNATYKNGETREYKIGNYGESLFKNKSFRPNTQKLISEKLEKALNEISSGVIEYDADFGYGFRRYRSCYTSVADENGQIYRIVGLIEDVQEEKDKERFIHDIHPGASENGDILENVFMALYETKDVECTIQSILKVIGQYYKVSRVYIFEDSEDHMYCSNTFEWCAKGIEPQKDNLQHLSYKDDIGDTYKLSYDEKGLLYCSNIGELPKEQYDILEPQGVRSILHCALIDNNEFCGYVGFDDCIEYREWTNEQIHTLTLLSKLIGAFLFKKRKNDSQQLVSTALADTTDMMYAIVDNLPSGIGIYEVGDNIKPIFTSKQALDIFGVSDKEYSKQVKGDAPIDVSKYIVPNIEEQIKNIEPCKPFNKVIPAKRADGTDFWLRVYCKAVDREDMPRLCYAMIEEVTERFNADEPSCASKAEIENKKALEIELLCKAVKAIYPMVVAVNLSKNSYYVIQHEKYTTKVTHTSGALDDFLKLSARAIHPDYKESFARMFSRENIIKEFDSGENELRFEYMQLGSDGAYHWIETIIIRADNPYDGDILEITLSRTIDELKKNEQKLRRALKATEGKIAEQNYYRDIVSESMPIAIILCYIGEDKAVPYIEGDLFSKLGYTREEFFAFYKNRLKGLVYEPDFKRCEARVRRAIAKLEPNYEMEYRVYKKDDTLAWILEKGILIADENGEYAYMSVCIDITKRKDEEGSLSIGEEEIEASLSQMGKMICRYDILSRTLKVTKVYAKKYNYPETILDVSKSLLESGIVKKETVDDFKKFYEAIHRGEKRGDAEICFMGADAAWHWEHCEFINIFDVHGNPTKAVISVEDITKEKKREAENENLRQSEQLLRILMSHSDRRVIIRYDIAKKTVYMDTETARKLGVSEVLHGIPQSILDTGIISDESVEDILSFYNEIESGKANGGTYIHVKRHNGSFVWLDIKYSIMSYGVNKEPLEAVISMLNVTKQHEHELAYKRYRQTIDTSSRANVIFFEVDLSADLIENQGGDMFPLSLKTAGEKYTKTSSFLLSVYVDGDDYERVRAATAREHLITLYADGVSESVVDFCIKKSQKKTSWIHTKIQMVSDPYNGNIKAYVRISDVTENKNAELEMQRRAVTDGMTGLYNKFTAQELIAEKLKEKSGEKCALVIIDMDELKDINDTFGHIEGDNAIIAVASVLKEHFRSTDIVGRVGGDEFMAFLWGISSEVSVHSKISSITRKLAVLSIKDGEVRVHASVGAAEGIIGKDDFASLYKKADTALYHVKRNGKEDYAFYDENMERDDYKHIRHSGVSFKNLELLESHELEHLLYAVSFVYPIIVSVNLSKNHYYMMENEKLPNVSNQRIGLYNELLESILKDIPTDEKTHFMDIFFKDALLKMFDDNETQVNYSFHILDGSGAKRKINVKIIFMHDEREEDAYALILGGTENGEA